MEERHRSFNVEKIEVTPPIGPALAKFGDEVLDKDVRDSVNEVFLCHGTPSTRAEQIAMEGFDFRLASRGFYGLGTYFASQACKCFQYCKSQRGQQTMIISR